MSSPYRVTLLGFSSFERSALASYFRLATNRTPAYEQATNGAEAHFVIVDADHPDAVRGVVAAGRVGDSVFIGANAPEGATAWMMRPIDPLHVLRELDAMVAAKAAHHPPMTTPSIGQRPVAGPARPAPARRASDTESGALLDLAQPAAPEPSTRQTSVALLVDDSEIALRFLETRLKRFGLQVDRASNSGRAIELLSRNAYDFIFLDVELGDGSDFDGLALCQHIKRQHRHVGGEPVVTMVSAHQTELDRARGALAGADAYLGKPLDDGQLVRLLRQHGVRPPEAAAQR